MMPACSGETWISASRMGGMPAMMVPMYLFYEASIIIGRFLKRQPRTV